MQIQQACKSDYPQMMDVWESAVKATHSFLNPEDFEFYKKLIPDFFPLVNSYVLRSGTDIFAFLGVADDKLEMLFVSDNARGQGYGKLLLAHIEHLNPNES